MRDVICSTIIEKYMRVARSLSAHGPGRCSRRIESRSPSSAMDSRRDVVRAVNTAGRISSATPSAGSGLTSAAMWTARAFSASGIAPSDAWIASSWPGTRSRLVARTSVAHSSARSPSRTPRRAKRSGFSSLPSELPCSLAFASAYVSSFDRQ